MTIQLSLSKYNNAMHDKEIQMFLFDIYEDIFNELKASLCTHYDT